MKILPRLAVLVLAAIPAIAAAEHPQTRQGFGISFGPGLGSGKVDCNSCSFDSETGGSAYVRLGGHVRNDMFVGFESNVYGDTTAGIDTAAVFMAGTFMWYPNAERGFYVKGSLGLGVVVQSDDVNDAAFAAPGVGLGLGYDIRVAGNFSITPYLNLIATGKGEVEVDDVKTGVKAKFNLVQIGVGFTWH